MRDSLKIGILTFHNAMSYGAVLQAYALQHTIENFGYETEVINYSCINSCFNLLINKKIFKI